MLNPAPVHLRSHCSNQLCSLHCSRLGNPLCIPQRNLLRCQVDYRLYSRVVLLLFSPLASLRASQPGSHRQFHRVNHLRNLHRNPQASQQVDLRNSRLGNLQYALVGSQVCSHLRIRQCSQPASPVDFPPHNRLVHPQDSQLVAQLLLASLRLKCK